MFPCSPTSKSVQMFGCSSDEMAPRFALESQAELRVGCEVGAEHLYRDVAFQARVASAVDVTHAAGAKRRDDLVWS